MSIVILVPAYKCESTITDTLESIQAQGKALNEVSEVIIADDGSHDQIAEIAERLWKSSVRLRILQREFNCGEYASVNHAVMQFDPNTEWFLIMHGDNKAKPGWLEAFLEQIKQAAPDVGLIGSSYDVWYRDFHIVPGENRAEPVVTIRGSQATVADTLMMGCWWHISSCAIRLKAYREVGGLPKIMQLKGDWDFLLRVLAAGWTIEHMPRSYMLYRENPQGSGSITFKRHTDVFETMTVVGRFHSALTLRRLFKLHFNHCRYLSRRVVGALLKFDIVRVVWTVPAFGIVQASFWTCLADPKRRKRMPKATQAVSNDVGR